MDRNRRGCGPDSSDDEITRSRRALFTRWNYAKPPPSPPPPPWNIGTQTTSNQLSLEKLARKTRNYSIVFWDPVSYFYKNNLMFGKVLLFFLSPSSGVKDWRTGGLSLYSHTPGKLSGYQKQACISRSQSKVYSTPPDTKTSYFDIGSQSWKSV